MVWVTVKKSREEKLWKSWEFVGVAQAIFMNTIRVNATIFNAIESESDKSTVENGGHMSEVLSTDNRATLWLIDSGATCDVKIHQDGM